MLKSMEISFDDLSEKAKERYLEIFCTDVEDINTDMPIAFVEMEEGEYHGE